MPVVYGTADIRYTRINGQQFQFGIFSRRSRFRAGTRYFARGIDAEGHVANYNETEQIVITENSSKTAFVQTRGSIPIFWAEVNNLNYKPDMQVMDRPDTLKAFKMHVEEQVSLYGSQSLVNLVNTKGHEQPVREGYEKYVKLAAIPTVQYHHFDFHKECKNMKWHRISVLLDQLEPELEEKGCVVISDLRLSCTNLDSDFSMSQSLGVCKNGRWVSCVPIAWITLTVRTLFNLLWANGPSISNYEHSASWQKESPSTSMKNLCIHSKTVCSLIYQST